MMNSPLMALVSHVRIYMMLLVLLRSDTIFTVVVAVLALASEGGLYGKTYVLVGGIIGVYNFGGCV